MKRSSIVPEREYVMFDMRPYAMVETVDDPLTIPVAPEPLLRMDPHYSDGGGGNDEGNGKRRPRMCALCWFAVLFASAIVLAQIAGIFHYWVW
jgi:hypothetical protein